MVDNSCKLVPPDGGWGWIICFAYILCNIMVLPIVSGLGLVFQEYFDLLEMSSTSIMIIITLHFVFGLTFSLISGYILNIFGYRKSAITGALFVFIGILLTAATTTPECFVITHSLITSIGVTLLTTSFSIAINCYFEHNIFIVNNINMLFVGIGYIIMPLYTNVLMHSFGNVGAIIILSAFSMHSLIGASLLRPIKWYLKVPKFTTDKLKNKMEYSWINMKMENISEIYFSENEEDYLENIMNDEEETVKSSSENNNIIKNNRIQISTSSPILVVDYGKIDIINKKWTSLMTNINLNESIGLFINTEFEDTKSDRRSEDSNKTLNPYLDQFRIWDILCGPVILNIMLGVSIAMSSQMIFEQLFPFILKDFKYNTQQIAIIMSIIATADIIFRFASPFIREWCQKSPRVMYLLGSFMFVITRTMVLLARTYEAMILVAVGIGITKGFTSIYTLLILSNYIPIEKLKHAMKIQLFLNIIIILIVGPILGIIQDKLGSRDISIVLLNMLTGITIVLWSIEYIYVTYKSNGNK